MPLTSAASARFSPTHVHLGVVDPEAFYLNHNFAVLGQRLGDVGVDEAVEAAELLQDDRTHGLATGLFTYRSRCGGQRGGLG